MFDKNRLFTKYSSPMRGKQEWIGAFSSSVPETVVAYALAGDKATACSLGPARSLPSSAAPAALNVR
jgi:hypothetical protein